MLFAIKNSASISMLNMRPKKISYIRREENKARNINSRAVFVYYLQLENGLIVQIKNLSGGYDKCAILSKFIAQALNKSRNCCIMTILCSSAILQSRQTIKTAVYGQNTQNKKKG